MSSRRPRRPESARRVPQPPRHVRSPVDAVRAAIGLTLVVVDIVGANAFDSTLLGFALDTAANVEDLPSWSRDLAPAALASIVIAGAVTAAVWSLLTTRYRRFVLYSSAIALAALASTAVGRFLYDVVDADVQAAFAVDVPLFRVALSDGRLSPADPLLASAVAALVVAESVLPRRLVRRGGLVVGGYAVVSTITLAVPPLAVLADVGVGLVVASALVLVFGRHDLALTAHDIEQSLTDAGVSVAALEPVGAGAWLGRDESDRELAITAFGRDDRSEDLVARFYRWLRFRKTGDHRPFVNLQRRVEHEALVWHQARSRGVTAPRVRAVAEAGLDGMVLVHDRVDGTAASSHDSLTDDLLGRIWQQASVLQHARIAHGNLNLTNFIVDREGAPWLVGFDRSGLSASDQRLGTDTAELLASIASAVGIERAVAVAAQAAGPAMLERALPWLQPLALTTATRDALTSTEGLDELRSSAAAACGSEPDELVRLERVDAKTLFVLVTIVLSGWFLVPQLTDLDNIWAEVKSASWTWALAVLAFSAATYVAATASLLGAIPVRLRFGTALLAQLASSFANRVTPARVGGVATNVRFFQRQGVPTAVGVTAVGLNAIAGLIMHILLTVCFLLLASGDDVGGGLQLPSTAATALGLLAIVVAVAGAAVIPMTRRLLIAHVLPQLQSGWASMRQVAQDPGRIALLFGGSAAITLAYMGAMATSLEAFGSTASLPMVGLLFLTGSAVANAAPTPGGLGAAEAALIAAFSTIEETAVVVPAVFLYRFVTFWLPIAPGWLALTYLRSTDNL